MLRMLDRHAAQALLASGKTIGEVARHFGVSRRTIQRIKKEPPVESGDDGAARRRKGVGRPPTSDGVKGRTRELLVEDPEAPPLEILRQLREEGERIGESTFYRVLRAERQTIPVELMVRFEGVAGEFAQFDFGQTVVLRVEDGRPVWNATLAQVAIDYGFSVELCAPRSPEQKCWVSYCTS
jgi:transposase